MTNKNLYSILFSITLFSILTSCTNVNTTTNNNETSIETNISNDTILENEVKNTEDLEIREEDNYLYKDVTSATTKEVEAFAEKIKSAYIASDLATIADMISYPIFVSEDGSFFSKSGAKKINNKEEFLEEVNGKKISDECIDIMKETGYSDMWAKPSSGISFCSGIIWFTDENFDGVSMKTIGEPDFKIISFSEIK